VSGIFTPECERDRRPIAKPALRSVPVRAATPAATTNPQSALDSFRVAYRKLRVLRRVLG